MRGPWIAAVLVFALLIVTAMVLGLRTEKHVETNRVAGQAARDFGAVSQLAQRQEILVGEYRKRPGVSYQFLGETRVIKATLARLAKDPRDSADALRLAAIYARFQAAAHRYFTALDRGRPDLADRIDVRAVEPAARLLAGTATVTTEKNADQADDSSSKLEGVSEFMLIVLPIAFVLAGGILYVLARAGRRSHRAEAEARAEVKVLEHAALTDSLTGLHNHRAFEEDIATAIAQSGRTNAPLCLISFDLDGLKKVNDSLGHQAGDRRLRQVAAAMLTATTPADRAYRVGGDEFALLIRDAGAWTGVSAAERVRAELSAPDAEIDVAAGVAEAGPREGKFDLVRHADVALINAKRTHRQVIVYSPELDGSVEGEPAPADQHQMQVLSTALARAVDAKDTYTRSHSETVSSLCVLIGWAFDLGGQRIGQLRTAGLLHDVGKIGTPDAILNKPGGLTKEEYETIKQHPVLGEEILRAADLDDEAGWVRHHHERPDGRGYPDALRADGIPLESRIIGVADAFEAMISDRPYREGRSEADAIRELENHAGTQFDPDCVAALREGLQISPEQAPGIAVSGNRASDPGPARPAESAA